MAQDPVIRVRSVYELIEQKLGIEVDFEFGELTQVGVAAAVIALNNPGRAALAIVNLSSNVIIVRPVNTATLTQGIRLGPNGGNVALNWQDDLIVPALQWSAIADGANSDVFVLEAIIK